MAKGALMSSSSLTDFLYCWRRFVYNDFKRFYDWPNLHKNSLHYYKTLQHILE